MFKFLSRYKEPLIIAALLLGPLISYLVSGHRGRALNFVDRSVLFISSPFQAVLTWSIEGVSSAGSGYVALRGSHEEAAQCRTQLAEAHAELNALKEAEAENARLKSLLGYVESTAEPEIIARVIGLNPSSQFQSIRINRGEDDGVRVGMPVVTHEGVVGQVVRAVGNSADVMLLTDPASRIGGVTQRARVRATITGRGSSQPTVDLVGRDDDAKDTDVVVTAGSDGIFPPGLVIGRISGAEKPTLGMFLLAKLVPAVELTRLEEVMVIPVSLGVPEASLGKARP